MTALSPDMRKEQRWSSHIWATLALGLPLVGTQIAQIAIATTDVVMLGWYGTEELAATVLGSQAFFVVYIFGSGFASAILPLAAQAEGRNDPTHVRRSVRMGMWILLLYAVLVMPFLWFLEPALIGLGQKPELAALASDYIRIAQWAMFPALMMMALRSFFAARSRAGIVLWSALIGTLVNGVLNYALIFGHFGAPEMGVRGAAVASVVSSTVIFLIMAGWAVLHPRHLEYRLFQRFWRPEWPAFFEVFRLGLPIGFTILAEVGLFMVASVMMGWLGTVPLAAHGIAIQLASISFMVPLGLWAHRPGLWPRRHGRPGARGTHGDGPVGGHRAGLRRAVLDFPRGAGQPVPRRGQCRCGRTAQGGGAAGAGGGGVPAGRRGPGDCRRPAARHQGHPHADDHRGDQLLADRPVGGLRARLRPRLWRPGIWAGLAIGLGVAAVLLNLRFVNRDRYLDVAKA
jgi:MATE family multidrug resistance protein